MPKSKPAPPPPPAFGPIQTFLALDLATKTGWALQTPHGVHSGVVDFAPRRFEGGGMRFLRFANWLRSDFLGPGATRPQAVLFEQVHNHKGIDAAHIYGGLMAHLTAILEHEGVPYLGVGVGAIKAMATGKGNAPKDAVIAAMRERGFDPKDDNEADALALMCWGRANLEWR